MRPIRTSCLAASALLVLAFSARAAPFSFPEPWCWQGTFVDGDGFAHEWQVSSGDPAVHLLIEASEEHGLAAAGDVLGVPLPADAFASFARTSPSGEVIRATLAPGETFLVFEGRRFPDGRSSAVVLAEGQYLVTLDGTFVGPSHGVILLETHGRAEVTWPGDRFEPARTTWTGESVGVVLGLSDALSFVAEDPEALIEPCTDDEDGDGVPDDLDLCPGTLLPDLPGLTLGTNRWASDGAGSFETVRPPGRGRGLDRTYTLEMTAGCSCAQILEALHLGRGHEQHGCSEGIMRRWLRIVRGEVVGRE